MELLKRIGVWTVTALLWLWAVLPRAIDWVGRTTLPDDWEPEPVARPSHTLPIAIALAVVVPLSLLIGAIIGFIVRGQL